MWWTQANDMENRGITKIYLEFNVATIDILCENGMKILFISRVHKKTLKIGRSRILYTQADTHIAIQILSIC